MKSAKTLLLAACVMAAAVLPILADQPGATGKENALARVEAATSKHLEVLTGLLSKVPEQARPAIEKALEASRHGHDAALAALSKQVPVGHDGSAASEARPSPEHGRPAVTGLEHARETVASAFEKSVSTLQGLIDKVPEQAVPHIQEALARIQENRAVALENLDRLIAGERPEHPRMDRSDRGERPEHPERPERAERPERPEVPDRPEPPERPERPEVPDRG